MTLSRWARLSDAERRVVLDDVLEHVPEFLQLVEGPGLLPVFEDAREGLRFTLFWGDSFTMGATIDRMRAADAAGGEQVRWVVPLHQPEHAVRVATFLLAQRTLEHAVPPKLADAPEPGARLEAEIKESGRRWFTDLVVDEALAKFPARGWRLPSEAEWEFAFRVIVRQHEATAAREADEPWEHGDAELCEDTWHTSFEGAPATGEPWGRKAGVLRTGSGDRASPNFMLPARASLKSMGIVQLRPALSAPWTPHP